MNRHHLTDGGFHDTDDGKPGVTHTHEQPDLFGDAADRQRPEQPYRTDGPPSRSPARRRKQDPEPAEE